MSKLIVSVFPDCGIYNSVQLNCSNVFIPLSRYRKQKNSSLWNPNFPKNYIDVVRKCQNKFDIVLVSSAPNIRHELSKEFKDKMVVVYLKDDAATMNSFLEIINKVSHGKDTKYMDIIKNNWSRWHIEAKLFCTENDIPYYEVSSTEEAKKLIEDLVKK